MQHTELNLFGELILIDGVPFLEYDTVMELEGLSKHFHHLERRKTKYPEHIKEQNGKPYMSVVLATVLSQYHKSHRALTALQHPTEK